MTANPPPARRGRRCDGDEAKRAHINFRVTASLKARLEAERLERGTTLSQEVERRLVASFDLEDLRVIVREEVRAAITDRDVPPAG